MGYAFNEYKLSIINPNTKRVVDSGCIVSVYNAGTQVHATIYENSSGTPKANPITRAVFNAEGQLEFAAQAASVDISVLDIDDNNTDTFGITPEDHILTLGGAGTGSSGGGFSESQGVWTPAPEAGWEGIAEAIVAATDAGGGTVWLQPSAVYEGDAKIDVPVGKYMCAVKIKGNNATLKFTGNVIDGDYIFAIRGTQYASLKDISNVTAGDTSVTITNANTAASVFEGDILCVAGLDANSLQDIQYLVASGQGDGVTGIVPIQFPAPKTFTSASIRRAFGSEYNELCANNFNSLEDISFEIENEQVGSFLAIYIEGEREFLLKNIQVKDGLNNPNQQEAMVYLDGCYNCVVENVNVFGSPRQSFLFQECYGIEVKNCSTNGTTYSGGGAAFAINSCFDCEFTGNRILGSAYDGIALVGSGLSRRNVFEKNYVSGCGQIALSLNTVGYENRVAFNSFEKTTASAGVYIGKDRNVVIGNVMNKCKYGIFLQGGVGNVLKDNEVMDSTSYGIIVSLSSCVGGIIAGNSITGGGGGDAAIYVSQALSWNIVSNLIKARTGKGIELATTVSDCLINSNIIMTTSSDGIKLGDDCDFNEIIGNHLRGLTLTQGSATGNNFISNKVS